VCMCDGLKGVSGISVDSRRYNCEGGWFGLCADRTNRGTEYPPKIRENAPKMGPEKVVSGAPGRGVLRFSIGGIQESRSFLGQKRAKNQKSEQFRG